MSSAEPLLRGSTPDPVQHIGRGGVRTLVPFDRWRILRVVAVITYAISYATWFRVHGLIIDRISVLLSIIVLLVAAHLGRPWYRWRRLALDLALYSAMWLAYEETRGAADRLGMPLQVESVRNIDRVLFLGVDPTVWLQQHFYSPDTVRWWDVLASIIYYTHFIVPVAVIVVLWLADRDEWVRFMRRFATVLAIGCISFILLPTAPPWMAAGGDRQIRLDVLPPLARPAGRGWHHLGLDGFVHLWEHGRDWVNRVAAMPSLHAAFALIVVIFFFPRIRARWVRMLLLHPLAMGIALVYLAEHYVIDVLAGFAVVLASMWIWDRIERRVAHRRAAPARAVIGSGEPVTPECSRWRRVLITDGYLRAAADPEDPAHASVRASYQQLLDEFEAGTTLLVARADVGTDLDGQRPEALDALVRPCRIIPLRRHLWRRARLTERQHPDISMDHALTLCVMDEEQIGELAQASLPPADAT